MVLRSFQFLWVSRLKWREKGLQLTYVICYAKWDWVESASIWKSSKDGGKWNIWLHLKKWLLGELNISSTNKIMIFFLQCSKLERMWCSVNKVLIIMNITDLLDIFVRSQFHFIFAQNLKTERNRKQQLFTRHHFNCPVPLQQRKVISRNYSNTIGLKATLNVNSEIMCPRF